VLLDIVLIVTLPVITIAMIVLRSLDARDRRRWEHDPRNPRAKP
jgi:hypothetical protein